MLLRFSCKILIYHCIVCKAKIGKLYFTLKVEVIRNCEFCFNHILADKGKLMYGLDETVVVFVLKLVLGRVGQKHWSRQNY